MMYGQYEPWIFLSMHYFSLEISVRHVQTGIAMYEHVSCDQREGMGQLEYQAVPSLRDVPNDGWLCTFSI